MSQTFEDYCQRLRAEAAELAPEVEAPARYNHLNAFNFGRSVERLEHAHAAFGLRLRWLLLGAAVGVTLAAVYLQILLSDPILRFCR